MEAKTPIQTINNDKSTLYIQQLHVDVTKKLLFREFSKFGQLKQMRYFPKASAALISYETIQEAEDAKRNLNHTLILNQKISISYYKNKDELNQKKIFNLFIKNVPPNLDTSILHNFLQSEFGDVAQLVIKKKYESEQNLGYGSVQFKKEEDFNKILKRQEVEGKITIKNSEYFFNVQKFNSKIPKTKRNKIHISSLFKKEVSLEEKEEKENQIKAVLEEIKINVGDKQNFSFYTEYNEQKKNFWAMVEFSYSNADDEDIIYKRVEESIMSNFKKTASPEGPQITFRPNENSERRLFLKGVKSTINQAFLASWLLKYLEIVIPEENIHFQKPQNYPQNIKSTHQPITASISTASLFFDSKKDGEKFMIFCDSPNNAAQIKEIFKTKHKITLYLYSDKNNKIQKQAQK